MVVVIISKYEITEILLTPLLDSCDGERILSVKYIVENNTTRMNWEALLA